MYYLFYTNFILCGLKEEFIDAEDFWLVFQREWSMPSWECHGCPSCYPYSLSGCWTVRSFPTICASLSSCSEGYLLLSSSENEPQAETWERMRWVINFFSLMYFNLPACSHAVLDSGDWWEEKAGKEAKTGRGKHIRVKKLNETYG